MTLTLQGIILALLIAFLVGILVGYYLVQGRLRRQTIALKASQRRLAELEQSYELRLRDTTDSLRREYEAELAETIEHYQDQLSQKTLDLEQTYVTRFQVLQQGSIPTPAESLAPEPGTALGAVAALRGRVEPLEELPQPSLTPPEVLHLKRQYELRLKEAAQKLQSAYEKQLSQHAKTVRADLQAEYEKRLAAKITDQEQILIQRQAELEAEYAARMASLPDPQGDAVVGLDIPTPSQIMGTGDETTVTLSPIPPAEGMIQRPSASTDYQNTLEARIQEATEQIRQDYEHRLSTRLEEYQQQMNDRLQELEASYQQQLQAAKASTAEGEAATDDDDDFGPLDLSDISQLT